VRKTAITGAEQTDRSLVDRLWNWRAELLWGFALAVLLFTFVNPVLLMGVVMTIATVAAVWLAYRELLNRADRNDAEAAATPVRPASDGRRDSDRTSGHAAWRGHDAA
jgi:hypothetical protein